MNDYERGFADAIRMAIEAGEKASKVLECKFLVKEILALRPEPVESEMTFEEWWSDKALPDTPDPLREICRDAWNAAMEGKK